MSKYTKSNTMTADHDDLSWRAFADKAAEEAAYRVGGLALPNRKAIIAGAIIKTVDFIRRQPAAPASGGAQTEIS